jgi:hypothetical protein
VHCTPLAVKPDAETAKQRHAMAVAKSVGQSDMLCKLNSNQLHMQRHSPNLLCPFLGEAFRQKNEFQALHTDIGKRDSKDNNSKCTFGDAVHATSPKCASKQKVMQMGYAMRRVQCPSQQASEITSAS